MSFYLGLLAFLAITSGAYSQKVLNNFAVPAAARPGENVTFYCLVDQDILSPSFCQWSRPGGALVTPAAYPTDEFEMIEYPESADGKRRCDFTLKGVKNEHHGVWKCQPNLVSGPIFEEGLAPFKFVVGVAPEPKRPVIRHNGEESSEVRVEAEQEVRLSCSLHRTRPKAQFAWYKVSPTGSTVEPILGAQAVESEFVEPGTDDLKTFTSNITVKVAAHENAMRIRCVANHTMLQDGQSQNSTEVLLSVQGQATVRQCIQVGSGMLSSIVDGYYCDQQAYYLAGKDGQIEVVFSSNPEPKRLEWAVPKFPGNPISSGEERDGFKAMHWEKFQVVGEEPGMEQFDRPDLFSAKLMINDLNEAVAGRYELRIFNGFVDERSGDQAYRFKFNVQIGEKPPSGVSSGVIVGVIVAILVILAVGFVLFAWRTSRMCFAEGESSVVEKIKKSKAKKTDVEAGEPEKEAEKNGKPETEKAANGENGNVNDAAVTSDEEQQQQQQTDLTKKAEAEHAANGPGTKTDGDAESAEAVNLPSTNGQTEGDNKEAAVNGKTDATGMKKRLSKLLPKTNTKKNKNKDGSKAEKVPLDVKKQTDVEAGPESKTENAEEKKDDSTLIYADLDLIKNTSDGPGEKNTILASEKTEYAVIVGTVNDNPPPPQMQK